MSEAEDYKLAKKPFGVLDNETAEPLLKKCIATERDNLIKADCANKLGLIHGEGYFGKTDLKEAVKNYKIAYDLVPDNLEYVHNLGLSYYNTQVYRKATPLLEQCAKANSAALSNEGKVTCASKLGHIYSAGKLGKVDLVKAVENYKIANSLEPDNSVFAENLAYYANSLGIIHEKGKAGKVDLNKALEYYNIAHQANPNEIIYTKHLADASYRLGLIKQAQTLFEQCLDSKSASNENKADAANTLGAIYIAKKLFTQAVKAHSKACAFAPSNPEFVHNLAMSHYHAQNYQQANVLFKQCAAAELTDHFTAATRDNCIYGVELSGIAANGEL